MKLYDDNGKEIKTPEQKIYYYRVLYINFDLGMTEEKVSKYYTCVNETEFLQKINSFNNCKGDNNTFTLYQVISKEEFEQFYDKWGNNISRNYLEEK